jgi:hypothetical protein
MSTCLAPSPAAAGAAAPEGPLPRAGLVVADRSAAGRRAAGPVLGHPAVVLSVVVAWLATLAVTAGAVLFGRTARTGRRRGRRSRIARVGLFLSLSGPWLALLGAVAAGVLTGRWLLAAAAGAAAVLGVALAGLLLDPH